MIHYVTGGLGAGKSYYAVRKIAKALIEGRVVVGNVELREDWAQRLTKHHPVYRFSGRKGRQEYARDLHARFIFEPELERVVHFKIRGRGEGRALLMLDEAHNDLNNRDWQRDEQREFLRWLTLARKKGYTTYIISQHKDNTDAAARRIASVEVRLVNWQQFAQIPLIGMKLLPWPVFLALAFPTNLPANAISADKVLYRELFVLGWPRRLYATHQLYGEDDDDPDAVWLPRHPDAVAAGGSPPAGGIRPADPERGAMLVPELFTHESRLTAAPAKPADPTPAGHATGTA